MTLSARDAPGTTFETRVYVTQPIDEERKRVRLYAQQFHSEGVRPHSMIIPVQGDYGSGKTFLLRDAMQTLSTLFEKDRATVLSASCTEDDPITWYRQELGPSLDAEMLTDVMTRMYAAAAERVAGATELTVPAVAKLRGEPRSVYRLITENLLNKTEIDTTLSSLLVSECRIGDGDVRAAFESLLWAETTPFAVKWLVGAPLEVAQRERIRVQSDLSTNRHASAVLAALSQIHAYIGRPFALVIDELEHFTRRDKREPGTASNVTWAKRLLDDIAEGAALVLVAGHFEAWETLRVDAQDRFVPMAPISMLRLGDDDVLTFVRARSGDVAHFDEPMAATVTRYTGGNIRRVVAALRVLAAASNNFAHSLSPEDVRRVLEQLGQKLSLDQATIKIDHLLENRGLEVQRKSTIGGIKFDLVASQGGRPRVVAELRESLEPLTIARELKRFVVALGELQQSAPGIIALFIVDGPLGDDASAVLTGSETNLFAFDLDKLDVLALVDATLDKFLGARPADGTANAVAQLTAQSAQLLEKIGDAQATHDEPSFKTLQRERDAVQRDLSDVSERAAKETRELESRLAAVERQRMQEAADLRARIDTLLSHVESKREQDVVALARPVEEPSQTLHVTFADLSRAPSAVALIGQSAGDKLAIFIAAALALAIAFMTIHVEKLIYLFFPQNLPLPYETRVIESLVVVVLVIGLVARIALNVRSLSNFHDFRRRKLREIYVRTESPELLVEADNEMRSALIYFGPGPIARHLPDVMREFQRKYAPADTGDPEPSSSRGTA